MKRFQSKATRFFAMLMSAALVVGSVNAAAFQRSVKADTISENDISISSDTISENEINHPQDESLQTDTVNDPAVSDNSLQVLDAWAGIYFDQLADEGLSCDNPKVSMNVNEAEGGIIFTAKSEELKNASVSVNSILDFGDNSPNRIMIDGVCKRATKTDVEIYLDDNTTPFIRTRLLAQKKEDNWSRREPLYFEIDPSFDLSGQHTLSLKIKDNTTSKDKKTSVMIRSVQFIQDSIPVINFNIDESYSTISDMHNDDAHETECYGDMSVQVPQGYQCEYGNDYKGGSYKLDYIRGRGNSTWWTDKKPYKIKLDKAQDLFQMGSNKHWVLLANRYDTSLVRNRLTYYLGKELGMEYSPQCISVDVYMNNHYAGNYLLAEQIRVGKDRVDIFDLEKEFEEKEITDDDDVSGGYLLSMEPYGDEYGYAFFTSNRNSYYVESPESDYGTNVESRLYNNTPYEDTEHLDAVGAANEDSENGADTSENAEEGSSEDTSRYAKANSYITNYMNELEDAVYNNNFKTQDGTPYSELMDLDSAVAYFWMQEFSLNGDAYCTPSTYLYKDKDVFDENGKRISGKLCWGPIWDFDFVAWGSMDYTDYEEDDGSCYGWTSRSSLPGACLRDPAYAKKAIDYWNHSFKPEMEKAIAEGGILDQYKEELSASAAQNIDKWGFLDQNLSYVAREYPEDKQNFEAEIERLRSWIRHRIDWVDANIDHLAPTPGTIRCMVDDEVFYEQEAVFDTEVSFHPEKDPEKEGFLFGGWIYKSVFYDEETNAEEIIDRPFEDFDYVDSSNLVDGVLTLYPVWYSPEEATQVDIIHFTQSDYYTAVDNQYGEHNYMYVPLNYAVYPSNALIRDITWESSDESIAYIGDHDQIIPLKTGDVTITATTPTGKKYSTNVHVLNLREAVENMYDYCLESVQIINNDIELTTGETTGLELQYNPSPFLPFMLNEEDGGTSYNFYSINDEVASVDNGLIIANSPGHALIVVETHLGSDIITYSMAGVTVKEAKTSDEPSAKPEDKPVSKPETKPETKPSTVPSTKPSVIPSAKPAKLKSGDKFAKGNLNYLVTQKKSVLEVTVTGVKKDKNTITIPATVTYKGQKMKVTQISASAFTNQKKLKKVTIGKNITSIGKKAFYNNKNLKTVVIKSQVLNKVGKKAFDKAHKDCTIQYAKSKSKTYNKLLKGYKTKTK